MAFLKASEFGTEEFLPVSGKGDSAYDLPIALRKEPQIKRWISTRFEGYITFRFENEEITPSIVDYTNSVLYQFPREIPYWLTVPAVKIWKNSKISFSNGNSYGGQLEFHYIRKKDKKGHLWVLRPMFLVLEKTNCEKEIFLEPWGFEIEGKFHSTPWIRQIFSHLPLEFQEKLRQKTI